MEYVYAALLLHKLGKQVDEEGIKKIISSTGIEIGSDEESKIKSLVVGLKGVDIEKELENASFVSSAPASVDSNAVTEKKEEKPKEEKKEAAAEGLSALFG